MISDSLAASASVSIRNQVFPARASQTYFMHPPIFLSTGWDRQPFAAGAPPSVEGRRAGTAGPVIRTDQYTSILLIRRSAVEPRHARQRSWSQFCTVASVGRPREDWWTTLAPGSIRATARSARP